MVNNTDGLIEMGVVAGSDINRVAVEACRIAAERGLAVLFEFNGMPLVATATTESQELVDEYFSMAHALPYMYNDIEDAEC